METNHISRFSELKFSNGQKMRNRIVIPPMASGTADSGGFVTEQTLSHYSRLACAQPGLLIGEYSFVHLSGRSETNQLSIHSDDHTAGLSRLAHLIQSTGALAGIQITHAGAKTERWLTGGRLIAPSDLAVPVKDRQLERPDAMTIEDIKIWQRAFSDAVDRAVQAGFDVIEFHSAHGYGLNQWLSRITNRREDGYGRTHQGRIRLLLEVVSSARQKYPNQLFSVRLPGQDFIEGGLSLFDSIEIAKALQNLGVDIIHVSSGIGGWRRPGDRNGEGYLVAEAEKIQAALEIPVIGVGGIETGIFIDESLRKGRFSLAAVGRAILKDPQAWFEQKYKINEEFI